MTFRAVTLLATAGLLLASLAWANSAEADASIAGHMARPDNSDGRFHYCRAMYRMNPGGDGGNWLTDYPLADIDLSIRLAELTNTRVGFDATGRPQHLIVRLTGDELFQCPFIMMHERYGDSAQVHARAVSDAKGRIMVFMTHNTDVSDSWEREGEDPQYFLKFSVVGYQVALNLLIYTMTH